jgi:hypothetical protein
MGRCSKEDSSGKCILDAEKPYRIDIVKEAIRLRITQPDLASTKIGLVEVGNYKAYGLSREQKCEAVKPLLTVDFNN